VNSYQYDRQIKFGYGSTPSYITVEKDKVKPMLKPVGATRTIRENGDVYSTIKAWTEIISFSWNTLTIADFNSLLLMVSENNSEITIYLEPTTNPATYETYNIMYQEFNEGVEVYTASGAVRQNVSIRVGRKYA